MQRKTESSRIFFIDTELVQMVGSHPALPREDDAFAIESHIDLYAISVTDLSDIFGDTELLV